MTLLGIAGYARSGKDTVGKIIVDEYGFERRAFADKLKEAALGLDPIVFPGSGERLAKVVARLGWDEAKKFNEIRRTLQRLGTEMGREIIGPDVWVNAMKKNMTQNLAGDILGNYVITDVRYQTEANWVRNKGGKLFLVTRPGCDPANDHSSEVDLDNFIFDTIIRNDGTVDDLSQKVRVAVSRYALSSISGQ